MRKSALLETPTTLTDSCREYGKDKTLDELERVSMFVYLLPSRFGCALDFSTQSTLADDRSARQGVEEDS